MALICVVLGLLTWASFGPVTHHEFIKFDDHRYVTDNPHVRTGLTWANVRWALTAGYASNWHPLTWVSHMCDVEAYGLRPGGHHLTNLLLHLANTLALWFVLWRMTSRLWASAAVAAFFAVHPLHVESVAWVAERKDVLSTLFFLLSIGAYALYAQASAEGPEAASGAVQPAPRRIAGRAGLYIAALLLFALGLMCKPMLVTLPFVLCLLDWWPLRRVSVPFAPSKSVPGLLVEKIPFLLLSILSCVATYLAQAGSHSVTAGLPFRLRAANAVVSYLKYIGKTFWPSNLAVFYPHPDTRYGLPATAGYPASEQWPWGLVLLGALLLAGISCVALWRARRWPWLFTGWFWYLGTLVPVIGLVQVGMQAMADRYMYIPSIGLFIAIVWGALELLPASQRTRTTLSAAAVALVICCAVITHRQTLYWHDNLSLFEHALAVTRHNAFAECNVGEELARRGQPDQAQKHFRAAQLADPRNPLAYMDLGIAFELEGKVDQAVPQYEAVVRLRPWSQSARLTLAGVLNRLGRKDEALAQYAQVLQLNPDQPAVRYEVASILAAQNHLPEAVAQLQRVVELQPDFTAAWVEWGTLLASRGRFAEAQAPLRQATALSPTNAALHLDLGKALMLGGKSSEAAAEFKAVVRLDPGLPAKLLQEGRVLSSQGELSPALARFNTALWLEPDSPAALSEVAWLLATHPLPQLRNGPRAVRLAQRALELSGGKDARFWASLDAACAESGRFPEAISAAQKARELALAAGDQETARACEARLALYQNQRAFHQSTASHGTGG